MPDETDQIAQQETKNYAALQQERREDARKQERARAQKQKEELVRKGTEKIAGTAAKAIPVVGQIPGFGWLAGKTAGAGVVRLIKSPWAIPIVLGTAMGPIGFIIFLPIIFIAVLIIAVWQYSKT